MTVSPPLPLLLELTQAPESEEVFRRLARRPHCLFLDSCLRHPTLGRYSFVAADPFDFIARPADGGDALAALAERIRPFAAAPACGTGSASGTLPPFQGGAAGLIGYDLGQSLERLPPPRTDTFRVPALAVGLYDVVLTFDHATGRAWIVSQGFPELEPSRRRRRAEDRLAQFRDWIAAPPSGAHSKATRPETEAVSQRELSAQHAVAGGLKPTLQRIAVARGVTSDFSAAEYLQTVRRVIDYIRAGDVFQVNLAQRLICPARGDATSLYGRLRRSNPAPFAGYFDLGDFQIASASPERFLRVQNGEVETRPIKGTRPRTGDPAADAAAQAELLESEKDRAENVMIVDLLRNDLSRVCTAESVSVGQLCRLEAYRHVFHLVSSVVGRLRPECSPIDLLRAAFPGGSVTGAPKVRAMEIIAELEPDARGAYCGSLGYLGFDGSADLNILIRTITAGRGWWQFPVGGGIVAQSTPCWEYDETWHKAEGLIRAL